MAQSARKTLRNCLKLVQDLIHDILLEKRTAQKDTIIDNTSDSQVNSNFPYRWSPASLTFNNIFFLFLYLYIIIIIGFLINVQVWGPYPQQWAPFQATGLLHAWQISHLYITRKIINNITAHLKSPKNQNRRAALGRPAMKLLGASTSLRSTNPRL